MKCDDVFKKRIILSPSRFRILNYPRKPVAVFNPGAILIGDEIHVFPRLVFDYYKYTSSIGYFKMKADELIYGNIPDSIGVEIIMWPEGREDLLGVEDPRVHLVNGKVWILYTAKGFDKNFDERKDYLGLAEFDLKSLKRLGYFSVDIGNGPFYPKSNKDSTFLDFKGNEAIILTRPHFEGKPITLWMGVADLENLVIRDLKKVREPEDSEEKLGWSTNAVKVNQGWLVGWHAVMKSDLSYRNGLAFIKSPGNFVFSRYKLCPRGLLEEYGDRALVIFGCGLLVYKGKLIWIGGVSDYAIGVFTSDFEKISVVRG